MPETIGPYKIETLLAKGGMSLLYLGLDPESRKTRVIKVLSPEYVNHPEMADHFLWEAKIISIADHPNIVKLYDYGKWEEGLYIAMEFIRGLSLRQFLIQQSFSLKRCIDIILQVAYALCHLHAHGVIHRDLKPENILIAEDGEVKVIDFGIAQLHEDEQPTFSHKVVGTPSYMAPEQKEDPQNASFASDIFSLGIIAYELILGKLSYGMINLTLLPKGLQKIIGHALAVSPSERYNDIVNFITDLTNYYKSPAIEKDRPGGDQVVEMLEVLQKSTRALSPADKPNWPQFEMGIAKDITPEQLGIITASYQFANNTKALIIAHTESCLTTSGIHIANLRGMIQALINPYLHEEKAFDPAEFASNLNTLVYQDQLNETYHLQILKLITATDTLSYLSCGLAGPLLHVPAGHNVPRTIESENPLIGVSETSEFRASGDTLSDGDLLIFHNLPAVPFEEELRKTVAANVLLSVNRLTEELLTTCSKEPSYAEFRFGKVTMALHRIS